MRRVFTHRLAKPFLWALCLTPAALLAWRAFHDQLGANPIEYITRSTGSWTLNLLLIGLVISPLRKWAGWPELIRFRRLTGLFAFFYGALHLLTFLWLDKFFDWPEIAKDIAKRPFIAAGFGAFVLLIPLTITSTAGWIRRLGGRNWQRLHRLVYASAALGVIHYYWLVKSDIRKPALYALLLGLLLAARLVEKSVRRRE